MKNTMKRSLAFLLLAMMLLTMLPLSAFAATPTYSWNATSAESSFATACKTLLAGSEKEYEIVTNFVSADASNKQKDGYYQFGLDNKEQTGTSFYGIQFNTVKAGTYTVTFTLDANSGANDYTVHAFPTAFFDDCTNTSGRNTKTANAIAAGSHKIASVSVKKGETASVSFSAELGDRPVIVFAGPQNGIKRFFCFSEVSFASSASTPAPTAPAATQPATAPATTPATEPSSGSGTDNSEVSMFVNWEVAAVDPVSTTYFTHATTGVVNGHDYLYLAARGGKLFVYDVDEDKQIASATLTATDTPRDIIVDENGIVWMSGGAALLRYDPFTDKAEEIRATEDGIKKLASFTGIVSDGKGKLYLGTMNQGYIICYDTATKSYSYASDWLGLAPNNIEDSKFAGGGGLIYKDGYLYLTIDGDINGDGKILQDLIKYDIANKKIVDSLNLSRGMTPDDKHIKYVNLVDNVLFLGNAGMTPAPLFVDISGSKLQFVDLPGLKSTAGAVTGEVNGKVYFTGYADGAGSKAFTEYDIATKTSKTLLKTNDIFRMTGSNLVTVEGDDRLPGSSVLIPYNDESAGVINVKFWNPQTNEVVDRVANIGMTGGAGSNLLCLEVDPTGEYIYMGAYGNLGVAKYSVKEGKVVDTFKTYSHQTDDLMFYDGYLYAGNYSAGTITQIDVNNDYALKPLFTLRYSVFEQCRMFNLAGGENKIFCSTVPYSGMGGVLVWYDFDKNLTYVAAGPNPEDVYYADTAGLTLDTNVQKVKYTWYNAVTGEAMDFDDDDDGRDDVYLADGTRRFSGFLPEQVINNMFYMDGYIFGTTSIHGASGTFPAEDAQPLLFAYDVKAMKVVATCDVTDYIEGFDQQVRLLDQFAADPDVPYKFWGGIDDTLYTCTFDTETNTFQNVKEEFSIQKDQLYSVPGDWRHRSIIFQGDYIYVGFGRHVGTYMVRKIDTSERYLISDFSPNETVLGADGNLYWICNETDKEPNNLNMFRIGEKAAPLLAKAPLDTAQRLINALPDKITKNDGYAIAEARSAYDKLTDEQKSQITGLDKLIAAEEAYAKLSGSNMTVVYIAIAAVVVLAGAAVAVVIVLKKKKKNTPDAE